MAAYEVADARREAPRRNRRSDERCKVRRSARPKIGAIIEDQDL